MESDSKGKGYDSVWTELEYSELMIAIVSGDVCLLIIYMLSNGWFALSLRKESVLLKWWYFLVRSWSVGVFFSSKIACNR